MSSITRMPSITHLNIASGPSNRKSEDAPVPTATVTGNAATPTVVGTPPSKKESGSTARRMMKDFMHKASSSKKKKATSESSSSTPHAKFSLRGMFRRKDPQKQAEVPASPVQRDNVAGGAETPASEVQSMYPALPSAGSSSSRLGRSATVRNRPIVPDPSTELSSLSRTATAPSSGSATDINVTPLYKGAELTKRAQATDFFRHEDREGQVRMKSNKEYPGTNLGVNPLLQYKLAANVLVNFPDLGYDPRIKDHAKLTKQEDGTWLLMDALTGESKPPEDGKKYIFVTMLDGTIRVGADSQASNGHARLAGYAPYVKYAGEVFFQNGKDVDAIAQSGTYLPPLDKEEQSGLSCKFRKDLPKQ